jgi:GTPase SAR1 family protein
LTPTAWGRPTTGGPKTTFKLVLLGSHFVGKTCISLRYCRGWTNLNEAPTVGASFYAKNLEINGTPIKFEVLFQFHPFQFLPILNWRHSNVTFSLITTKSCTTFLFLNKIWVRLHYNVDQPSLHIHGFWFFFFFFSNSFQSSLLTPPPFQIQDTAGQERYASLAPMYYRGADGALLVYDITNADSFEAMKKWDAEISASVPECAKLIVGSKVDLVGSRQVPSDIVQAYSEERNIPHCLTSSKTGEGIEEAFHKMASMVTSNQYSTINTLSR